MHATIDKLEQRRLRSVAREFREKGYEVVLQPGPSDLPDGLSEFPIDLLARNGKENVLVEVRSRGTLREEPNLVRLAEIVERLPGWRLDLVVTNPRRRASVDEALELPTRSELCERLSQARQLMRGDGFEAAILLVWSAAEGALRRLAKEDKIRLESQSPRGIVEQLHFLGVIPREAYDAVLQAVPLRDALIHGYKAGRPVPEFVERLFQAVDGLVQARTREEDVVG